MSWQLRERIRRFVRQKIIGVKDTPHRIAFGAFLGLLIGWTPTLGFQIVIYLAVATALRANKISGVPFVFISNPLTAGPLYYWAWWVGSRILNLGSAPEVIPPERRTDISKSIWDLSPVSAEFWLLIWEELVAVGVELWLGSFVMGIVTGVPAYLIVRRAVRRAHDRELARGQVPGESASAGETISEQVAAEPPPSMAARHVVGAALLLTALDQAVRLFIVSHVARVDPIVAPIQTLCLASVLLWGGWRLADGRPHDWPHALIAAGCTAGLIERVCFGEIALPFVLGAGAGSDWTAFALADMYISIGAVAVIWSQREQP